MSAEPRPPPSEGIDQDAEPTPEPCAALWAEVRTDCATLAARRRRRYLAFGLITFGVLWVFGEWGPHAAPTAGTELHRVVFLAFLALGVLMSGLAFGLFLPTGRALRPMAGGALVLGVGLVAVASDSSAAPTHSFLGGAICLGAGGVVSGLLALVGLALGRRVVRQHAPTGLLMGVGVGMVTLAPLHAHCGDVTPLHLISWHGLVPVVSALLVAAGWLLFGRESPG